MPSLEMSSFEGSTTNYKYAIIMPCLHLKVQQRIINMPSLEMSSFEGSTTNYKYAIIRNVFI